MALFHRLFREDHRAGNHDRQRIFALFEIAYTAVDFAAAALFIVGSIMFFYEDLMRAGTWMFLIGSVFFAVKPALRLWRELKLLGMGDTEDLAERLRE